MGKDFRKLNRSLAMVIAAAMVATSTPAAAFAAEIADPVATEEVAVEEVPEIAEEEPVEEVSEVVEEEPVTAAEEDVPAVGVPGTPAKVTDFKLYTDEDNSYIFPLFKWTDVDDYYKYEFMVKDVQGNVYGKGYDSTKNEVMYKYVFSEGAYGVETSLLSWLNAYDANGNQLKDANGRELYSLQSGQTYTIQVRAVYWDGTKETPGEWSDPVAYTVGNYTSIKNLALVREDDALYFNYDGNITEGHLVYEVSETADFSVILYPSGVDSNAKLAIDKDELQAGVTYYIRAYNSVNGLYQMDADGNPVYSNVVAFSFQKKAKVAKNITGFKLYKTNVGRSFQFVFNPILEEGDWAELQWSTDPNFAESNRFSIPYSYDELRDGNMSLDMYRLETDKIYYVRAVGYAEDASGNKVYGQASEIVQVSVPKLGALSAFALKEKTQYGYVFGYEGNFNTDDVLEVQYSQDPSFPVDVTMTTTTYPEIENSKEITRSYDDFVPGKTYYIRARVCTGNSEVDDPTTAKFGYYSAYTAPIALKVEMSKLSSVSGTVTGSTVTLNMEATDEYRTGYVIYRKVNGKWSRLAKTTDSSYKDSGLKKDTKYTYRVRPYYYDEKTKKNIYGSYKYYTTMTWGAALNLQANPTGTNKVQLKWNKVSGAKGYEIYRVVADSNTSQITEGGSNYFSKYTLIKTITNGKTVKYTDQKLTKNVSYSYIVRAYKTVGKQKYYIEDAAYVDLAFGGALFLTTKEYAGGSKKITWNRVYAADGYLVEKYDETTERWTTFKKLKKSAKSVTLPANSNKVTEYRVRAYKGNEYSDEHTIRTVKALAAPTGVTATSKSDGSVAVSWKAVAGADYYKVYRTTSSKAVYNKDTKSYEYDYGYYSNISEVPYYVADTSTKSGYKKMDADELTGTSLVDRNISYTVNGVTNELYKGPKAGVKYYYYVAAYKNGVEYNTANNDTTIEGRYSKADSATVSKVSVKKASIQSVKNSSKGKAVVTWKKVSGTTGYAVYRSTKKGSGYSKIAMINSGKTVKYTDSTVTKGKTYYYKVRAIKDNEAGADKYGAYSNAKKIKINK